MPRFTSPHSRAAALFLICGACAAFEAAHAAWETVPELSIRAESDDNVLLDSNDGQSASSTALDANVTVSNFTERGNVYIRPRIVVDAYSGSNANEFESDDIFFDAGGEYNWRTVSAGFRSSYSEQIILDSEFSAVAPEDPDLDPGDEFIDPDTGRLVFFSEDRERLDLRGNLDFRISERNRFRLDFRRQNVAYSGAQAPTRSDFDNTALSMGVARQVDDRNTVTATVTVSEFHADRNDNRTDSVGIVGGFSRELTETWTFNLNAGVERSEYSFAQTSTTPLAPPIRIENAAANSTFGFRFTKRAQRTRWDIDLRHNIQPNGNGFLVLRDSIRASTIHEFSPRLTGRFGALFSTTETLDDTRLQDNRDYTRFEASVEWALRQTLFLVAGFDQTGQKFVNEASDDAVSNSIFLGITYRGRSRQ